MTEKWAFTCPECGGHRVEIEATVVLRVEQCSETREFETFVDDCDYAYDSNSLMTCLDCNHQAKLKDY